MLDRGVSNPDSHLRITQLFFAARSFSPFRAWSSFTTWAFLHARGSVTCSTTRSGLIPRQARADTMPRRRHDLGGRRCPCTTGCSRRVIRVRGRKGWSIEGRPRASVQIGCARPLLPSLVGRRTWGGRVRPRTQVAGWERFYMRSDQ